MPIAFVKAQNAKPVRRSIPIRQEISISRSPQNFSQKQAIIRPNYNSSEVFYTDAPEKVFSILGNSERKGSKLQLVAKPPRLDKFQPVINPVSMVIFEDTHSPEVELKPNVISGRDFLKEITPTRFKPSIQDDLQYFAQNMRRKAIYEEPFIQPASGKETMKTSEILRVTGAANDPLRALQILPGITAPNSILAGLYVRGGGPDDNSYYFDRVYLSYPYHFIGLATTINSAAIESVDVYAGGFGAEFGNAQTVIDIHANPSEREKFSLTSNLNMLMSELMLESPLGRKGALYVAGRRSYADLIVPKVVDIPELTQFPMFWDYQTGFDYDLTPKQRLHFNAFSTKDFFKIMVTEDFGQEGNDKVDDEFLGESHYITGFNSQSLTLNSLFGDRFKLQSTISHRRYTMDLEIGEGSYYFLEKPDFYALRGDAEYEIQPKSKVQIGGLIETGDYRIASYFPRMPTAEDAASSEDEEFGPFNDFDKQSKIKSDLSERFTTKALYFQEYLNITGWLDLKLGTRVSHFNVTDEFMIDPRASLILKIPYGANIRAAWGIYHQNPTPAQILPGWGNPEIKSSYGTHYVLELEKSVLSEHANIKLAGYYKDLKNLITKHPTEIYLNQGTGYAQGLEMLLKYNPSEHFLGWLSYTYSLSRRKDNPDAPESLYIFDQTHVATLSISYKPTANWELGARWSYTSGTPIAPKDEKINELREPATHRLDLRFVRVLHIGKNPLQVYLDVLNAYNYSGSVSVSNEAQEYVEYQSEEVTVPVIPYLGISMKF